MHPLALREPHLATHMLPTATPEPRHSLTTHAFCFVSSTELQYPNQDARTGRYQNREIPETKDDRRARSTVHQSIAVRRRRPTIHLDENPIPDPERVTEPTEPSRSGLIGQLSYPSARAYQAS